VSFKRKYRPNNEIGVAFKQFRSVPRAGLAASHDVAGEYAVLMMGYGRGTPVKSARIPQKWVPVLRSEYAQNDELRAFSGFARKMPSPQNLDAPPLSPYTSAAPRMDVILNPRAALKALSEVPGMEEDF
jgi:hypothetical protein